MNLTKKFLWTWKAVNGPALVPECRFHPLRKWRFDFAHFPSMVGIELEGGIWIYGRHTRPVGMVNDIEKYNEAALIGWTVFRLHDKNITVKYLERIVRYLTRAKM